jgi:3',5'-cyclic AMP phosphodiesterase CpdA
VPGTKALLIQLSDPHLGADWGGADAAARLAAVVTEVRRIAPEPVAVIVSGDLAEHAADGEYQLLEELLAPLAAPIHVLPGNHDDRAVLRRHFALPGVDQEPVQYSVALGALRLLALDSTDPGHDGGRLDGDRIAWFDAELAVDTVTPTIVALHHPPLVTGMPAADAIGLPAADTLALGGVLARHPQVRRVIAGHFHRTVVGELAGVSVLAAPSTYLQATLDLSSTRLRFGQEPPAFALHFLREGALASHVATITL